MEVLYGSSRDTDIVTSIVTILVAYKSLNRSLVVNSLRIPKIFTFSSKQLSKFSNSFSFVKLPASYTSIIRSLTKSYNIFVHV